MTLEEAIKENKDWLDKHPHLGEVDGFAALPPYKGIQLGVEALQRERDCRANMPREEWLLLPSESKELETLPRTPLIDAEHKGMIMRSQSEEEKRG